MSWFGQRRPLSGARPALVRWARALICAGLLGSLDTSAADDLTSREYDVKAVLLYNFTQFVRWPESAFPNPNAAIVIGILGHDPFGPTLDAIVRSESVGGRRIVVERFRTAEAARRCHILFVTADERANWPKIAPTLRGHPVLTVAEFDGFVVMGGMVHLSKTVENKLRLRINLAAVRAASLNMSGQLLRVAEITSEGGKAP